MSRVSDGDAVGTRDGLRVDDESDLQIRLRAKQRLTLIVSNTSQILQQMNYASRKILRNAGVEPEPPQLQASQTYSTC